MAAKQEQIAVLHHVVPTFGVQAARLPDLGGGAQPGQIGATHHLGPDKTLARIFPKFEDSHEPARFQGEERRGFEIVLFPGGTGLGPGPLPPGRQGRSYRD